jgi:hypothetical protein
MRDEEFNDDFNDLDKEIQQDLNDKFLNAVDLEVIDNLDFEQQEELLNILDKIKY